MPKTDWFGLFSFTLFTKVYLTEISERKLRTSDIEISTVKLIVALGTCIVVVCVTTLEQFLHQTTQGWNPVLPAPLALL